MAERTERQASWFRILAVAVPIAAAGLIGWGTLRSDVDHNTAALDTKASRDVMTAQYEAILRELQAVNSRLDRMEHR